MRRSLPHGLGERPTTAQGVSEPTLAWEKPMLEGRQGPRNYKIFICHRYGDHQIYAALRHALDAAAHFSWTNLSIQPDRPLRLRTENGLKASLTHKVKNADIVLVLSHSAGPWIDHEIDT